MNPDPIAADWQTAAPLQLALPLLFKELTLDPATEQDHPELFEPQQKNIVAPPAQ